MKPTIVEKRKRLAELMGDCPACEPSDADEIPDADLDKWLESHGCNTDTLELYP